MHISKYDRKGGAAIAAGNSVAIQCSRGLNAKLLVGWKQDKRSSATGPSGIGSIEPAIRFTLERLPFRIAGIPRYDVRSIGFFGISPSNIEQKYSPDVIVLHGVDGVLSISSLPRFTVPIVWRMHDMWPICGSKHYTMDPDDYLLSACNPHHNLIEKLLLNRKHESYRRIKNLILCPPSNWLMDCAKKSWLLRDFSSTVIPNGIDTNFFRPIPNAREKLGLPDDKPIFLFGAHGGIADPRKGFDLLLHSLIAHGLQNEKKTDYLLLVFGSEYDNSLIGTEFPVINLGYIGDRSKLPAIYSAADIFIAPSRIENLSLAVLEALSCGTPALAFETGGMPDMIRNGQTGWLVPAYDTRAMSDRIKAVLLNRNLSLSIRDQCRRVAELEFDLSVECSRMTDLFERILNEQSGI